MIEYRNPEILTDSRSRAILPAVAVICAIVGYCWILGTTVFNLFPVAALPLILLGSITGVLTILDLRIGLAIQIFSIGISPEIQAFGISNLRIEDFLFPILLATWFMRSALDRNGVISTGFGGPLLLGLLITFVSSLFNLVYGQLNVFQSLFRHGKMVEYLLIFVIVLHTIRKKEDIRTMAQLLVLVGALVGAYCILQLIQGASKVTGPPGETANILGGYFTFNIAIALGLMICSSSHRIPCGLAVALMGIPLLFTMARTSYIAIIAALASIFIVRRHLLSGLAMVGLSMGIFLVETVANRFGTLFGLLEGASPASLDARIAGWKNFMDQVYLSPLLGHGVGNVALGAYDSQYVQMLHEVGILGTVLFAWLVMRCLRMSAAIAREGEQPELRGYALGFFGGTVGLLVHGLAAPTLTAIRSSEIFYFGLGLLAAISTMAETVEFPERLEAPVERTLLAGITRKLTVYG